MFTARRVYSSNLTSSNCASLLKPVCNWCCLIKDEWCGWRSDTAFYYVIRQKRRPYIMCLVTARKTSNACLGARWQKSYIAGNITSSEASHCSFSCSTGSLFKGISSWLNSWKVGVRARSLSFMSAFLGLQVIVASSLGCWHGEPLLLLLYLHSLVNETLDRRRISALRKNMKR